MTSVFHLNDIVHTFTRFMSLILIEPAGFFLHLLACSCMFLHALDLFYLLSGAGPHSSHKVCFAMPVALRSIDAEPFQPNNRHFRRIGRIRLFDESCLSEQTASRFLFLFWITE